MQYPALPIGGALYETGGAQPVPSLPCDMLWSIRAWEGFQEYELGYTKEKNECPNFAGSP